MGSVLLALPIDPVMFRVGPIDVRWYGLSHGLAIVVTALIIYLELKRKGGPISLDAGPPLMILGFVVALVGGRLGYVMLHDPAHFLAHPQEILATWRGGLTFHTALASLLIAGFLYARRKRISFLELADIGAVAVPLGLMFIKLGNFINGESYGSITSLPWAVAFPRGGGAPRHPCQIYEAILEGPILFVILWRLRLTTDRPGQIGAGFLIGYGLFRFLIEFIREPDNGLGVSVGPLSIPQVLSLGMVTAGMGLLVHLRKPPTTTPT